MKKIKWVTALLAVLFSALVHARDDAKGSSDHQLLGRYPDFYISQYAAFEYDEAEIATGVYDFKGKIQPVLTLEGKVTNINYRNNDKNTKVSSFQLFKNYERALKKLNAEVIFSCRGKTCYKNSARNNGVFINNAFNHNDLIYKGIRANIGDDFGILTAKILGKNGLETHLMISVSADMVNKSRSVSLSIIESSRLDDDNVGIGSVEDLREKMAQTGKVELTGIYFDNDKASLKKESDNTLKTMADYLKSEPASKFFVVGHTDNTGSYQHNKALSENRAQAVADRLVNKSGIPKSQLLAVGVGSVSPQSANTSEQGRALNRRVELVLNK